MCVTKRSKQNTYRAIASKCTIYKSAIIAFVELPVDNRNRKINSEFYHEYSLKAMSLIVE